MGNKVSTPKQSAPPAKGIRAFLRKLHISRGNRKTRVAKGSLKTGGGTKLQQLVGSQYNSDAFRALDELERGRLAIASSYASSAVRSNPKHEPTVRLYDCINDVKWMKREAEKYVKVWQWTEAADMYQKALDAHWHWCPIVYDKRVAEYVDGNKGRPFYAMLLLHRGMCLFQLERYQESFLDIDASLALVGDSFEGLHRRAHIHLHFKRYEAAISDFKHAEAVAEDIADRHAMEKGWRWAEKESKKSQLTDNNAILGVPSNCSAAEIQKASETESVKHHPDRANLIFLVTGTITLMRPTQDEALSDPEHRIQGAEHEDTAPSPQQPVVEPKDILSDPEQRTQVETVLAEHQATPSPRQPVIKNKQVLSNPPRAVQRSFISNRRPFESYDRTEAYKALGKLTEEQLVWD